MGVNNCAATKRVYWNILVRILEIAQNQACIIFAYLTATTIIIIIKERGVKGADPVRLDAPIFTLKRAPAIVE